MEQYDSRVDAYIAKAAPFAKPILEYIRQLVHETSPQITENIKWGFPFYEYKGVLCNMSAFKQHCALGFWKVALLNDPGSVLKRGDGTAGSFGPITTIADLPAKEILTDFIRQAMALNENDVKVPVKKAPVEKKAVPETPDYFLDFLADHPNAKLTFESFSPSHKREYVEWIVDAKTDATRLKRMQTALEWLSEGKSRHWRYK
ncbi:uncharacterized protein YdeI (YjbR/CyaY-like superfamily) [Mucilaginibacter frigoritolerans]|jgi:uncharacterized protein YdeI (YjbR/CyaY-like superfamily)|uniref:Uncharacterized protein YdeI (YjbR/CyaY-like superfamily) n=1 Tax=Mucilaginibacter frigoritolerans TaxID=652788 RepID=A0A562U9F2_9SPHI|nr:DUF1801 domain-containing protein [Mucilaginibacter frigoritolerans]TWJ02436.1 uncharacterized protein YdeI (YjbR/CyaY-like superfamily) [Mucilaginibacter frigoritolerans]